MSDWIADLSKGWPTLTGSVLKQLGASGVIGYAGCDDTAKNVSKARFEDWLNSGLMVALVIENGSEDLKGGTVVGAQQGKALSAAAKSLGYDSSNCVLFASADWNSRGSDLDAIDAAMAAMGNYIGIPSLYGNSYAIDRTCQTGTSKYGWQSESTSFSNGLSAYARLQQLYNDPRAQGRALDVNDVVKTPLLFMGESVTTPKDVWAWNQLPRVSYDAQGNPVVTPSNAVAQNYLAYINTQVQMMWNRLGGASYSLGTLSIDDAIKAIQGQLSDLQLAVNKILAAQPAPPKYVGTIPSQSITLTPSA